jgi:hypothetical protein
MSQEMQTTHIRNGNKTTTITTTNHWSREMAVSPGPQRTLATRFMKLRLRCLDKMRHVYFTRISAQLGFVTGIKQQPLPQLVTGHVKMTISLGP